MNLKELESEHICSKCKFGILKENNKHVCGCSAPKETTSNKLALMGCECIQELYMNYEYEQNEDLDTDVQ